MNGMHFVCYVLCHVCRNGRTMHPATKVLYFVKCFNAYSATKRSSHEKYRCRFFSQVVENIYSITLSHLE